MSTLIHRASATIIALNLCVIVGLSCRTAQSSLGNYNGSLKDLFPENVGEFKKVIPRPLFGAKTPQYLNAKDAFIAFYDQGTGRCGASVYTLNFSSVNEAREGLKEITRRSLSETFRGRIHINKLIEGSKKQGEDRIEIHGERAPEGRTLVILWTNGSVLFILQLERLTGKDIIQCEADIFDFEKRFPY